MSQNTQNENQKPALIHWSDFAADRIIRQNGDKKLYTLASGITPSGVVHFGNFRETITVDLVARALRKRGKNVRFIFSWDDYDTFRKIPKNMPNQEELEKYLFKPIVETPDPYGKEESYAAHHEVNYEAQLKKTGIKVEAIYQARKYQNGDYNDQILKTLRKTSKIREILNQHRSTPLDENWLPLSIYCENCGTDKIKSMNFTDEQETVHYECANCGFSGKEDILSSKRLKLPWRLDWPMRWVFEDVDFEPGGKDHSSQGGSFTTGKELVKEVYGGKPPIYLQYDFVSIKGGSGKMSSSSGEVVTVNDVLEVYEPEILRYIFASYKTNIDFSVSFDLDVIKVYEDFDRMERLAFGIDQGNEKKIAMAKKVYELSQLDDSPESCPIQPSFRHLCNVIQINSGDLEKTLNYYKDNIKTKWDERRLRNRANCAINWLNKYAPEDFKFSVNKTKINQTLSPNEEDFFKSLHSELTNNWEAYKTDKDVHEALYKVIHSVEGVEPSEIFPKIYQRLISKEKGPKLAGFIRTIGKSESLALLNL